MRDQRIRNRNALSPGVIVVLALAFALALGCEANLAEDGRLPADGRTQQSSLLQSKKKSLSSSRLDDKRSSFRKKLGELVLERGRVFDIGKIKDILDQAEQGAEEPESESSGPPLPETQEPSSADYGPPVRMIGLLTTTEIDPEKDPCPLPSPDTGWRGGRVFSIERFANELCEELQATGTECREDTEKKIVDYGVPEQLFHVGGVYCEYFYDRAGEATSSASDSDAIGNGEEEPRGSREAGENGPQDWKHLYPLLDQLKCDKAGSSKSKFHCYAGKGSLQLEIDPATVVPQNAGIEQLVASTREIKHDFSIRHFGGLDSLPKGHFPVRVAVLDTSPPGKGNEVGMPVEGKNPHGLQVALLIRKLSCPSNSPLSPAGDCMVGIDHYLALNLERDEEGRIVSNKKSGGSFGTPVTLAFQVWKAVVRTGILFPGARLVINMSVGWENLSDWTKRDLAGDIVAHALHFAACHNAISFAAAGNSRLGSQLTTGPVGPAGLESYDQMSCGQLVYSVGGLDGMSRILRISRDDGMPKLAAHAYQVVGNSLYKESGKKGAAVFDEPPRTGTSMPTAALSAIASLVLSFDRDMDKTVLVNNIMYGSGDPIRDPREADYCSPDDSHFGSCPQIRRVTLCNSLSAMFPNITCETIPEEEPIWTAQMMDMLESDAGVIDSTVGADAGTYTELTPPPASWVCGDYSVNVPAHDSNPTYVCPDRQLFNNHVFTYLSPEPTHVGCDVCLYNGNVDFLHVMFDDESRVTGDAPPAVPGTPPPGVPEVGDLLSLELKLTDAAGDVSTFLLASETSTQTTTIEDLQDGNFVSFDLSNVTGGSSYSAAEIVQVVQGHNSHEVVVSEQIPLME